MADTELESQGAGSADAQELSYLSMALDATRQTSREDAEDLLKNLTREVMAGTVKWNKTSRLPLTPLSPPLIRPCQNS